MDTTSIADTTPSTEINEITTPEVATELVGDQNTIVAESSDQSQDILTPPVSQSQDTVTEDIPHNSFDIPSEENNDEVTASIEVTPSNTEEPSELTQEEYEPHQEDVYKRQVFTPYSLILSNTITRASTRSAHA